MDLLINQKGATGKLEESIACILEVLSKAELDQHGSALKGRDPSRIKTSPLVWTEGKHQPCNICNGKHGEGKHLWRDCPERQANNKSNNRKGKPDSTTKGAAKLLSGAER